MYSLTILQAYEKNVSATTSVLVIGGSRGTGHLALQLTRCFGAHKVTTICSSKNNDFCRLCGATEVIDYSNGAEAIISDLMQSPHMPFHVVMDCVSSADPRDMTMNYPDLIQRHPKTIGLLTEKYIYQRLGGPSLDWIRAGVERTIGMRLWPD
jgi:D-arabinose 1-dehydrogenase-like Zn-dependent alcohol dehydrogenase